MLKGAALTVDAVRHPERQLPLREHEPLIPKGAEAGNERGAGLRCACFGESGCEPAGGRIVGDQSQRGTGAGLSADGGEQPDGQQGVSAEREEVVIEPDVGGAGQLAKKAADQGLAGVTRRVVGRLRGHGRRRQCGAVEFAVDRERKAVQRHEGHRDHVVRQAHGKGGAQGRGRRHSGSRGRDQIGDELIVAGDPARRDGRLVDDAGRQESNLDLAGLDTESPDLHLLIGSPEELEHAIRCPSREIARAVHSRSGRPERRGQEALGCQARAVQVASREPRSCYIEFADDAGGNRRESSIENKERQIRYRFAHEARRRPRHPTIDRSVRCGVADRGFRRPPHVDNARRTIGKVGEPGRQTPELEGFAAEDQILQSEAGWVPLSEPIEQRIKRRRRLAEPRDAFALEKIE